MNLDAFMLLHSRTKGKQIHILYTVLQYGPSGSIGHVLTQKIALSTKNRAMWMIPNSQHVLMYLWRIIIIFHVLINLYYWSWTHRGTMQRAFKFMHTRLLNSSLFFSLKPKHTTRHCSGSIVIVGTDPVKTCPNLIIPGLCVRTNITLTECSKTFVKDRLWKDWIIFV